MQDARSSLQWALLAAMAFALSAAVQQAVFPVDTASRTAWQSLASCLLTIVIAIIAARTSGVGPRFLALRAVPLIATLPWLAAVAAVQLCVPRLSHWLQLPTAPGDLAASVIAVRPWWLRWCLPVLFAPIAEELLFRGLLYQGLAASRLGPPGTIALTTLIWTALHASYDPLGLAAVAVIGLLFGVARWRSGSLWVPLAMHSLANLIPTLQATAAAGPG